MFLLALFCFGYYIVVSSYMRKWNSTFAGFWPLAGVGFVLLHVVMEQVPSGTGMVIKAVCLLGLLVFLIVEGLIIRHMRGDREMELSHIIVLGAQVDGHRITDSLAERLDKALEYLVKHPRTVCIVSGGQGQGELVTEAEAMCGYLLERGISEERIFSENESTTTKENLQYSTKYIPDCRIPIGIVTNNFHMYRAKCYAVRLGYHCPCGIPAGCDRVMLPNYMVREFFALCKMWLL